MRPDIAEGGTEAARRVADVLMLFTGAEDVLGVSEISRRVGLSKAVVHRILRSLVSRELILPEQTERGYRLGPAAAAIGARALRDSSVRRAALPVLRRLQQDSGETATVSEVVGTSRVYLDQILSKNEVKMTVEIGRRFPLHAGASSKAILAFAHPDLQREVLEGPLEALTPHTKVDRAVLETEMEQIRRDWVVSSSEERLVGATSVAAPILNVDGCAVGGISICGPVWHIGPDLIERLRPMVRDAAQEISRKLGWSGGLQGRVSV